MNFKSSLFILKAFSIFSFLLLLSSCTPSMTCTTNQEYVEKQEWDKDKGFVESSKASWSIHWE